MLETDDTYARFYLAFNDRKRTMHGCFDRQFNERTDDSPNTSSVLGIVAGYLDPVRTQHDSQD